MRAWNPVLALVLTACGAQQAPDTPASPQVAEVRPVPSSAPAPHAAAPIAALTPEKACAAGDTDACASAVASASDEEAPIRTVAMARAGCRIEGATDANRAVRGVACRVLGAALASGHGVQQDRAAGATAHALGCTLGDKPSCAEAARLADERSFDTDVKEHVGAQQSRSVTMVNGVMTRVACNAAPVTNENTFTVSRTVLQEQEKALKACAKDGAFDLRIVWTAVGGRVTKVNVLSPESAAGACVKRAFMGARDTLAATCLASARISP